jgi:hypothetical protein
MDELTSEGEMILRKAPPNFEEELEKEAMLLSNEDLRLVQEKIDDIIFEAFELGKDEREKITKFFEVYTRDGDNSPSTNCCTPQLVLL